MKCLKYCVWKINIHTGSNPSSATKESLGKLFFRGFIKIAKINYRGGNGDDRAGNKK